MSVARAWQRAARTLRLAAWLYLSSDKQGHGGCLWSLLPLPPETIRVLECYLRTERPLTQVAEVFVSLKGPARGRAMTPAGLRSLFRHHRSASDVPRANAHRFRHTFASDMIRAGVSLPALMRGPERRRTGLLIPRQGDRVSLPLVRVMHIFRLRCCTFSSPRRTSSRSMRAPSRN